jgi:tetratricopeptide (TPR) repeat protein
MRNPWLERGAILLLTGVLMVGCTTPQAGPVHRPAPAAPNAYYYYTEAQLLRAQGEHREALALMQQAMGLDPDSRLLQRETAVLYLQLKNEDAALALLEKLLAAHPDDIEALNIMGRLLQSRKRNDDAKRIYARILAQDPDNEDIYILLGNLYMADAQWDAALDVFEQLVQRFPDAYAGYFFLGKIYRAQNDPVAAEKAFRKALQIEPELEGARFELIELYAVDPKKTDHQNKIVQLYEELLKDNPQNIRAIFGYALFERDRGQTEGANRVLTTYAGDISQNDLIRGIFRYYLEAENYGDADYLLTRLIELHPGYNDLHYLQGLASDGLKEYEKALAQFRAVTSQSRFYREATIQIAFRYAEDERHDLAIAHLEDALAKDPDNTEFLIYLGSFNEEVENYEAAEGYLRKAIETAPDNERAYFRLGVVYDKMKRKDESIAAMKRVIELNDEHANALNYLGYTYADLGINLDEAEALVRKALNLRPDDGYITDSLGWVYYKKGQYEEALKWLLKASELVPQDPIILEHVGDAYLKLDERTKALQYYQKSLSLRDEDSEREKIQPKIDALKNEQP